MRERVESKNHKGMNYRLSDETRRNLKVSTGFDYVVLTERPIASFHGTKATSSSCLISSRPRIIKPRGSVYLQLDRILTMSKVRKSIFK